MTMRQCRQTEMPARRGGRVWSPYMHVPLPMKLSCGAARHLHRRPRQGRLRFSAQCRQSCPAPWAGALGTPLCMASPMKVSYLCHTVLLAYRAVGIP